MVKLPTEEQELLLSRSLAKIESVASLLYEINRKSLLGVYLHSLPVFCL